MILVINSGSSSLKFKVYDDRLKELAGGIVERIGLDKPFLDFRLTGQEKQHEEFAEMADHTAALAAALGAMKLGGLAPDKIKTVGHRVVHGGEEFVAPTVIDAASLARLETYNLLAPLHNPPNLAGIKSCLVQLPQARNVAVFDTAFYRTLPPMAYLYALPRELHEKHKIRKYGFHGISHAYVVGQAAKLLKRPVKLLKLVSCHIGSGASVTAVKGGRAVDTTMGFTPLEGLTMSTRCGDIDPAIPLYLIRTLGWDAAQVDDVLNKKSGMLGLTGHKDMRDVLARTAWRGTGVEQVAPEDEAERDRCRTAIDVFCYDVARYVGQFSAIMGGVDAVIFTAGVGERNKFLRDRIMGMVKLPGRPKVMVIPTDEELMIAKEAKTR
ncbi:hypothetical protein A3C96_04355 [Candidatus Uhrbacteria bacterium RIFCSPHIGHO2_02_FULL_60_10]|uniref:Acetate kinase n=1 Tax=Candidatus Uhrbacteria bacterium RIFCSPHIGHO2_02_FULL_60_10 TaxID=1802392 RepID=A0A1F7U8P8_9BACT|nr:MAG: hypothetical protein A3C96_04355 [Candidatus Uhrbacteria bacterium RIFCSPHIGHO2_02_FULL_60_10]